MSITYSVLLWKLEMGFSTFQFSFSQVKMVNHFEDHVIIHNTDHQLQEIILHHFLHYNF